MVSRLMDNSRTAIQVVDKLPLFICCSQLYLCGLMLYRYSIIQFSTMKSLLLLSKLDRLCVTVYQERMLSVKAVF